MVGESKKDAQQLAEGAETTAPPAQDSGTETQSKPVSEEELLKEFKGKDEDIPRGFTERLRTGQIASVYFGPYIDARSSVYVGGKARITQSAVGHGQVRLAAPTSGALIQMPADRVSSVDLKKVRAVYVQTPLYATAQRILAEQYVLILWGHAHWGKWTTALHLLSALHADEIFEINMSNVDLEELCSSELESKQQGYAINTLTPDGAGKLNVVLKDLSRQLKHRDSHLVITVDSRVSLAKEALSDHLMVWSEVPDRSGLLEKHLIFHLVDEDALDRARELSQVDAVQQLLSTYLLPGEIDCLAKLLAEVTRGELEMKEALARFEANARQQVEAWFEGKDHIDLEERTFMLSVAVLSGANEQAVFEADERLQSLIRPSSAEDESPTDTVFSNKLSKCLGDYCAHMEQGYEEAEFGPYPVKLIVLNNPTFRRAVLHYVWDKYGRLRRPLLAWLHGFGLHPNFDVRVKIAEGVGELSKCDFGYVREQVLLPWGNHQDSRARVAAALALGIPVWEGEFAPQVVGLLHHWSTLRNNWRLCWTAAAAYGGLVGLRFPETALRDLYTIAQAEDLRLFKVLSRSVANLFEAGRMESDYYLKVLDALIAWTDDLKAKFVTLTGLLIFLKLALEAQVEADPEGGVWPTLLWLAREDEAYRDRVTHLWRRALNTKAACKPALDVLRQWLLIVDDDTRLYSSIKQIITALATQGTDRERERLRFYLGCWASHPKEKSKSAAEILLALNRTS